MFHPFDVILDVREASPPFTCGAGHVLQSLHLCDAPLTQDGLHLLVGETLFAEEEGDHDEGEDVKACAAVCGDGPVWRTSWTLRCATSTFRAFGLGRCEACASAWFEDPANAAWPHEERPVVVASLSFAGGRLVDRVVHVQESTASLIEEGRRRGVRPLQPRDPSVRRALRSTASADRTAPIETIVFLSGAPQLRCAAGHDLSDAHFDRGNSPGELHAGIDGRVYRFGEEHVHTRLLDETHLRVTRDETLVPSHASVRAVFRAECPDCEPVIAIGDRLPFDLDLSERPRLRVALDVRRGDIVAATPKGTEARRTVRRRLGRRGDLVLSDTHPIAARLRQEGVAFATLAVVDDAGPFRCAAGHPMPKLTMAAVGLSEHDLRLHGGALYALPDADAVPAVRAFDRPGSSSLVERWPLRPVPLEGEAVVFGACHACRGLAHRRGNGIGGSSTRPVACWLIRFGAGRIEHVARTHGETIDDVRARLQSAGARADDPEDDDERAGGAGEA